MAGLLKDIVDRMQQTLREEQRPGLDYGTSVFRRYDVQVLMETIKHYGGRRDWTPTPANIARLPGPVRRYVIELLEERDALRSRLADAGKRR